MTWKRCVFSAAILWLTAGCAVGGIPGEAVDACVEAAARVGLAARVHLVLDSAGKYLGHDCLVVGEEESETAPPAPARAGPDESRMDRVRAQPPASGLSTESRGASGRR